MTNKKPSIPTKEAIKRFKLNHFEKVEIEMYHEVWYAGQNANKIEGEEGGDHNGGYDDETGCYIQVMNDHMAYRYETLEMVGKGSFGQVVKATDHKYGDQVAIKIIRNKKKFHHQALIEVKILDHLKKRDPKKCHNIIHMVDFFYFRNHLCIVFELMGPNLYELTKENKFQGFSIEQIKSYALSLLKCLTLLHRENIIHCDLKPENVLVKTNNKNKIRVIDFGSSCFVNQRVYTYIQSRFYRSPEIILGLQYGTAIDMWSLGCILAELYGGYPLFPGTNEADQLACIMELQGPPPQRVLQEASRKKLFFEADGKPKTITTAKGKIRKPGTKKLGSMIKCKEQHFLNFLSRCLEWDPFERITPLEALKHEWLREEHETAEEEIASSFKSHSISGSATLDRNNRYRPKEIQTISSTIQSSEKPLESNRRSSIACVNGLQKSDNPAENLTEFNPRMNRRSSAATINGLKKGMPLTQDTTENEECNLYQVYRGRRRGSLFDESDKTRR